MLELLISVILVAVAVESLTSIVLCEDSLFHKVLWSKVQAKIKFEVDWYDDASYVFPKTQTFWLYLHKFVHCNYCISVWISVSICPWIFSWDIMLPLAILATWRLSHYLDAIYRYYLVRSFVADNADIEG